MELLGKVVWPKAGKYVIGVSGGVDSVALLDILVRKGKYDLVVAHADHGWRGDSRKDVELVGELAKQYDLPLENAKLVSTKSEAEAREARYEFLRSIQKKYVADGIITAHHWDDQQETSLHNLLRGTGIRGVAPMASGEVIRPLLNVRKRELIEYAKAHNLAWREDSTNLDTTKQRNRLRHETLPALRKARPDFDEWHGQIMERAGELSTNIDQGLDEFLDQHAKTEAGRIEMPLKDLNQLSLPVLRAAILAIIRRADPSAHVDAQTIQQLALQLKTGRAKRLRKLNNRLCATLENGRLVIATLPKNQPSR